MSELPIYIRENLHKVFIGLVTVLILLIPATLYVSRHLPFKASPKKAAPKVVATAPASTKTYTNSDYKYSVSYPNSWTPVTAENTDLYTDQLFYPSASDSGKTIGVRVLESVGDDTSTKDYFNTLLNHPIGEENVDGARVVKLANVKVDDEPAVMQLEQSVTPDGLPYASKNVYVFKNGKLYVLMNSGESPDALAKNDSIFNKIVGSFKFLN